MLNENYEISERTANTAFLKWTAPNATDVSWIFVNGVYTHGAINTGKTERAAYIRWTRSLNKCIEIHDLPLGTETKNICFAENSRPSIEWSRRMNSTATKYRIYHQNADLILPEAKISEITVSDDRISYDVRCSIQLDEGWHFFRVVGVNEFGIESTVTKWTYLVYRIPKPVNTLVVANGSGSGLFNFTIT